MNVWSHLPNAHHIDRVIESAKSHPEIWAASEYTSRNAVLDAVWDASRNAAVDAVWNADLNLTLDAVLYSNEDVSEYVSEDADLDAAQYASNDASLALIAYDDSSKYLEMPSDHLRILAILSETPSAVLLLPAVIAFEKIRELECV
jgi:hypothetical protein